MKFWPAQVYRISSQIVLNITYKSNSQSVHGTLDIP